MDGGEQILHMKKEEFEHYYKEYHALVFRIAFSEVKSHTDADDILQEVFLRLLRYDPKFKNKEHEKAWMIRTTINLCKDFFKNKWNQNRVYIEESEINAAEKMYFKIPYVKEDETLWAVLALKERYRQPLYLFYYEDYSIKEIARILSMPESTVKTNLRRGKEAVRELLLKKAQKGDDTL